MVCGQCGDELHKIPFIKTTQIFSLIAVIAFISPLILMVFSLIDDLNRPQLKRYSPSMVMRQELLIKKEI